MIWLHIFSDLCIPLACVSLLITLLYFFRRHSKLINTWVFVLLGACGVTLAFFLAVWAVWHPTPWILSLSKIITAGTLVWTAALITKATSDLSTFPDKTLEDACLDLQTDLEVQKEIAHQYKAYLDLSTDIFCMLDPEGHLTQISDNVEKILGYARDDLLGESISQIVHPEHREIFERDSFLRGEEQHAIVQVQTPIIHQDGSSLWMALTLSATSENFDSYIVIIRDIDQQKRVEQVQHLQSEIRLCLAKSNTSDEVIPQVIQAICENLQWDRGELWAVQPGNEYDASPARTLSLVTDWQTEALCCETFAQVSKQTVFPSGEGLPGRVFDLRRPLWMENINQDPLFLRWDAARQDGLLSALAIPLQLGEDELGVLVFLSQTQRSASTEHIKLLQDVSSQVSQFLKRQSVEQALRQSEIMFSQAFEYAAFGIALISPKGHWLKVNDALCRLLGYSENEILRLTFQDLTHPDDLAKDLQFIDQVLKNEIPSYSMEKRYFHREGHVIWVLLSVSLVRDQNHQPLFLISQVQDITNRKLAEFALNKLWQNLEIKVEERTHELSKAYQELENSQREFEDLYHNAPDMYLSVEAETSKIVRCNQTLCETLGYSREDLLGRSVVDLYHPDCLAEAERAFEKFVQEGEVHDHELQLQRVDGGIIDVSLNLTSVLDENGKIKYGRSSWRDITQRKVLERELVLAKEKLEDRVAARTFALTAANEALKQEIRDRHRAEEFLREREAFLSNVYDSASEVIWVAEQLPNGGYQFISVNQAIEEISGIPEALWMGKRVNEIFNPKTAALIEQNYDACLDKGMSISFEEQIEFEHQTGYFLTTLSPLIGISILPRVLAISTEISDRKQTIEALQSSESILRSFYSSIPLMMGIVEILEDDILHISDNLATAKFYNREPGTMANILASDLGESQVAIQQWLKHYRQSEISGQPARFDYKHHTGDQVIYFSVTVALTAKNEDKPSQFSYVAEDISDRRRQQAQIEASLREKEALLQEIHHRVKNNLQVISSLLNLQSKLQKDPSTLAIVRDSQSRVRSMALIHEKLYGSSDLANINFADYIQDLVKYLFRSYQQTSDLLTLKTDLDFSCLLNIEAALPCGLIINELVTNSLKYAFPEGKKGEIYLELHSLENDTIRLIVGDTGKGIPSGMDIKEQKSLGLKLVSTLVKQINGKLSLSPGPGTEFQIVFPQ